MATQHRKHFIPLESDPELFTELIHRMGISPKLAFHDVLSLDDSDLLAMVPRPALALVLTFPAAQDYQDSLAEKDAAVAEYVLSGEDEDVVWFKQTIGNACGLYAILHAVLNGGARDYIGTSGDGESAMAC